MDSSTSFVIHLIREKDIIDLLKCIMNGRLTKANNESNKHQESVAKIHSNVNEDLGLTKYYARNEDFNHYCSSSLKFGDPYFWHRVCEHFTSENIYTITPKKYEIHQVLQPDNKSSIVNLDDGKNVIKESRFSYIRPVDGVTRLKLCNCSNITGLEQTVHRKSQVIVEIPNSCMIVFTGDTYHAGVSSFDRRDGGYPSFLRIFSYIVEENYVTDDENISSLSQNQLCKQSCKICSNMNIDELHYTNQVIKYDMRKHDIESLKEGTVLMGDLQKVGWVVLKSGFIIKPRSLLEDALYDLNVDVPNDKLHWFGIDKCKRQMYYKQSFNINETRFVENESIELIHDLLKKDCEVINDHLIHYYDFDDTNYYKYYNPNVLRNLGFVKKDQTLHLDFPNSLYQCKTISNTTSHESLPVKKRKSSIKDNNPSVNPGKRSPRKKKRPKKK